MNQLVTVEALGTLRGALESSVPTMSVGARSALRTQLVSAASAAAPVAAVTSSTLGVLQAASAVGALAVAITGGAIAVARQPAPAVRPVAPVVAAPVVPAAPLPSAAVTAADDLLTAAEARLAGIGALLDGTNVNVAAVEHTLATLRADVDRALAMLKPALAAADALARALVDRYASTAQRELAALQGRLSKVQQAAIASTVERATTAVRPATKPTPVDLPTVPAVQPTEKPLPIPELPVPLPTIAPLLGG